MHTHQAYPPPNAQIIAVTKEDLAAEVPVRWSAISPLGHGGKAEDDVRLCDALATVFINLKADLEPLLGANVQCTDMAAGMRRPAAHLLMVLSMMTFPRLGDYTSVSKTEHKGTTPTVDLVVPSADVAAAIFRESARVPVVLALSPAGAARLATSRGSDWAIPLGGAGESERVTPFVFSDGRVVTADNHAVVLATDAEYGALQIALGLLAVPLAVGLDMPMYTNPIAVYQALLAKSGKCDDRLARAVATSRGVQAAIASAGHPLAAHGVEGAVRAVAEHILVASVMCS
jgi:hypothetical protein